MKIVIIVHDSQGKEGIAHKSETFRGIHADIIAGKCKPLLFIT